MASHIARGSGPGGCSFWRCVRGLGAYYARMARRRAGELLPIEIEILRVAAQVANEPTGELHGFELASRLAAGEDARKLHGHGTIYKALGRLEAAGLLSSRWEVIDESLAGRPRRRLYRLTASGATALASASTAADATVRTATRWAGT